MLRYLLIVLLTIGFFAVLRKYSRLGGAGDFSAQSDLFDFGVVSKGEVVTANFDLMATGGRDIKVIGVELPCICTTVSSLPVDIVSGMHHQLDVRIDTKNLDAGKFREQLEVFSSSQSQSRLKLNVVGEIVKP